jgi:hypothetical protein
MAVGLLSSGRSQSAEQNVVGRQAGGGRQQAAGSRQAGRQAGRRQEAGRQEAAGSRQQAAEQAVQARQALLPCRGKASRRCRRAPTALGLLTVSGDGLHALVVA